MAFSYVGNFPNQQVSNSGVLSLDDINNLESTGELGGSLELIDTISQKLSLKSGASRSYRNNFKTE